MENNAYFEQVKQFFSQKSEQELVDGIARAEAIVSKLSDDPVWKTLLTDIKLRTEQLDAHWQDVYEKDTLDRSRVLKKAFMTILELPERYKIDLDFMKRELADRDTSRNIVKDYDDDTREER